MQKITIPLSVNDNVTTNSSKIAKITLYLTQKHTHIHTHK